MAISKTSPAWNVADSGSSLATDERGQARPSMGGFDIGAFELCENKFDMPCIITARNEQTEPLTMQISPAAGGSTTPAAGLTNQPLGSVTALTATASAGYTFAGWTGNVTAITNSSTTIIMNNAQTVTANFAECTCAGNVSASVTLTFGAIILNASHGRYTQTVTVKNTSANTITGPISLVLDGLNSDVMLFNETGTTDAEQLPAGSPYINASGNLAAGQKIVFALQSTAPSQARSLIPPACWPASRRKVIEGRAISEPSRLQGFEVRVTRRALGLFRSSLRCFARGPHSYRGRNALNTQSQSGVLVGDF